MNRYFANLAKRSSLISSSRQQNASAKDTGSQLTNGQVDIVTQTIEHITPSSQAGYTTTQTNAPQNIVQRPTASRQESIATSKQHPANESRIAPASETTNVTTQTNATQQLAQRPTASRQESIETSKQQPANESRIARAAVAPFETLKTIEYSITVPTPQTNPESLRGTSMPVMENKATEKMSTQAQIEIPRAGSGRTTSIGLSLENHTGPARKNAENTAPSVKEMTESWMPSAQENCLQAALVSEVSEQHEARTNAEMLIPKSQRFVGPQAQTVASAQKAPMPLARKSTKEPQINIRIGAIQLDIHQAVNKTPAQVKVVQVPAPSKTDSAPALNLHRHYLRAW